MNESCLLVVVHVKGYGRTIYLDMYLLVFFIDFISTKASVEIFAQVEARIKTVADHNIITPSCQLNSKVYVVSILVPVKMK